MEIGSRPDASPADTAPPCPIEGCNNSRAWHVLDLRPLLMGCITFRNSVDNTLYEEMGFPKPGLSDKGMVVSMLN